MNHEKMFSQVAGFFLKSVCNFEWLGSVEDLKKEKNKLTGKLMRAELKNDKKKIAELQVIFYSSQNIRSADSRPGHPW